MADIQVTSHDETAADSPEEGEAVKGHDVEVQQLQQVETVNGSPEETVNGSPEETVNGSPEETVNGNPEETANGNGVEVHQQEALGPESPTLEELREFDIDRRDYLLIKFNLPTQISEEKKEDLIHLFQREGESSYQFGGDYAQWRMDVRLIQEGELPEVSVNEAGQVTNHLVELYKFTSSDLLLLERLDVEGILHVAEDASWVMERLHWEIRERRVRVPNLMDELERPEGERILDTGVALLEEIKGEDYYWDSRKLCVCTASFLGMFERFAYSWQMVLRSVRLVEAPDLTAAQLLDLVSPDLLDFARWLKKRLGERVVNFWELCDRLRDVEHPDVVYTDPVPSGGPQSVPVATATG